MNAVLLSDDSKKAKDFLDKVAMLQGMITDSNIKKYEETANRLEDLRYGWDKPEMLETPGALTEEFPKNVFPEKVEQYIQTAADTLQVPRAMTAAAALAVTSTAAQGRFKVRHPEQNGKHLEDVNLYLLISAVPGYRKTAVIKEFMRHVYGWKSERIKEFSEESADYKAKMKALDAESKAIEKSISKPDLTDDERNELTERLQKAERSKASTKKPESPHFLLDDTTAEAVPAVMQATGERAALITAEGTILQIVGGMYSGSNPANVGIFLKGYNAEPFSCNRAKGLNITLNHPLLTICVFAQPEITAEFLNNGMLTGQGLTDRFLIAEMPPKTEATKADNSGKFINKNAADEYMTTIKYLLDVQAPEYSLTPILDFAEDAGKIMLEYEQSIYNAAVGDGDLTGGLEEYSQKAPAQCERIAALLHILAHPCTPKQYENAATCDTLITPISRETTENAIRIHQYFVNQRKHKRDEANMEIAADAQTVLAKILKATMYKGTASCSKATLRNNMNHWKKKTPGLLDSALTDLQNAGFIEITGEKGKKKELIYISPHLMLEEISEVLPTKAAEHEA